MADKIEIFDSKQAFDDLTKLSTLFAGLQTQLNSMATSAANMNTSLNGITSINSLNKATTTYAASQSNANTKMSEAEKLIERKRVLEEKIAIAYTDTAKSVATLSKELSNANAEHKKSIASFSQTEKLAKIQASTYLKLQVALAKLKKEYQDLAVKQNLGISLSAKEEARLTSLTTKVTKLDGVLKKTDAGMGVHTRNVGNYGKAFDSLGFSVAQMTRESPAFLISMNTGFMALSNNIPIFVDEINRLAKANKALVAEGKPQVNIWKKVGLALFSWQSMISMGILLLTIYGGKLVEMASSAIKGANSLDLLESKQEEINKTTGESTAKFMGLISVIKDVNKSEKDRLGAMDELKSAYPDFNAAILLEKDNTDLVSAAIESYIIKLGKKAKAQAAMTLLQEKYAEQIAIEESARKKIAEITGEENTTLERQKEISDELQGSLLGLSKQRTKGGAAALKLRDVNNALEEQKNKQDEINKLLEIYVDNVDFSIDKNKQGGSDKSKRNKIDIIETKMFNQELFGTITYLEEQIKLNKDIAKLSTNKDTIASLNKQNEAYQLMIDKLNSVVDYTQKLAVTKWIPDAREIGDFEIATTQISNFVEQYGEQIDQAIDTTNAFFDNRLERLEQDRDANEEYYDDLISLAEGNQEEQDRLEREKQIKDDELRNKQNEIAKKQAIFNKALAVSEIAINTARAIVGIWAEVPKFDFGISATAMTAVMSALGAAQIASVIAQPVPKFKDGKPISNNYEGLAIVNDGGKTEYREDRLGNISAFKGVNTLTHVAKDDIIHKDLNALISSKGYNSDDIYKSTVMASLASERGISTYRLEKVLDNNLKDIDKKIIKGVKDSFKNVNFNSYPKIDLGHVKFKNNTL